MSSSEPAFALMEDLGKLEEKWREFENNHKRAVGEANFEAAKVKAGRLSALGMTEAGKKWLKALVPKDDEIGCELARKLNNILENPDLFDSKKGRDLFKALNACLQETRTFYQTRIDMYVQVFKDEEHGEEAKMQLCTLASILDATFKRGYANIFESWIKIGDEKALSMWTAWANGKKDDFKGNEKMTQDATNIAKCYLSAYEEDLAREYKAFFENVAARTGGTFKQAPMKTPLRAVEKTAFRHDDERRWKCDNVYDVMRGSISYPSMEGIKAGVIPPPTTFFSFCLHPWKASRRVRG
jgi:hypothetical protein